jgi:phage shock protein PspC (stress-responsive transcriptional regulator)
MPDSPTPPDPDEPRRPPEPEPGAEAAVPRGGDPSGTEPPPGQPDQAAAGVGAGAAGTSRMTDGDPLGAGGPERPYAFGAPPPPPPRKLERSSSDRLLGGVAGGLGRHLGVDPLVFRIAFVVLSFAGGFGVLAYLIGLVAMPADDATTPQRWGLARTVGAGLLAAAAVAALMPNWLWGPEVPGLILAGLVVFLLVRAVRDDDGTHVGRLAARIALGIALVALAAAGFAAAAAGSALGGGILIAGLVIALGVALIGGAFRGGARWLIVPAFVLALPLGVVSAADLDLEGDWGERTFRPATTAEVTDGYRMGVGHMQIDLRRIDFPSGRTELPVELGVGEIEVAVPDGVCVTYDVEVGAGEVRTLDGIDDDGLNLDVTGDAAVPAGVPELHVDAQVGVGAVRIGPGLLLPGEPGWWHGDDPVELDLGPIGVANLNDACTVAA